MGRTFEATTLVERVKVFKKADAPEGVYSRLAKEVKIGPWSIEFFDKGLKAKNEETGSEYVINLSPVGSSYVVTLAKSEQVQVAVGGIPSDYIPAVIGGDENHPVLIPLYMEVAVDGLSAGEVITLTIEYVPHDYNVSGTKKIDITIDANGVKQFTISDIAKHLSDMDGKAIIGIQFWAVSNLDTTNATVNVFVFGQKV